MSPLISSLTTHVFQGFAEQFYSRRLLLHTPFYQSPDPAVAPTGQNAPAENSFDANVIMVLSVLLCALICSLGLNYLVRCTLRCSRFLASEPHQIPSTVVANKGIKKKALKTFPTVSYSTGLSLPGLNTECVICLSEFTPGEKLKVLPKCNHGFHVRCIDKWLNSHSSCPTCRHCLIETCQKIVGCSSSAPIETILTIAPLEPEGVIREYRGVI